MTETEQERLQGYLEDRKTMVDRALDRYLPAAGSYPPVIFEASRYSLFAGGKRIRPILCIAAAEALGGRIDAVLPAACALEMIHTYSLIHDDLPAMDDDALRRGKPTNHMVYGEGIAVLAGDALLTDAFRLIADEGAVSGADPGDLLSVINEIARAAGYFGMIGGQAVDLDSEGKGVDYETLQYIHRHKTAALITVSLRAGGILAGGTPRKLSALTAYGENIGLLFQIVDDILNVEGDAVLMGKETGSDRKRGKATYPSIVGMEPARRKAAELVVSALASLTSFDDRAEPLRLIARHMMERKT
ncbi:MAG: polyprenyl synthetase family protein [Syntrophales bacterium]|nr:polyprenyl synthetase family protein [Syntrophales bacterium]MCK9527691.1 polyprenyl synthetase family protein [Syntrophales bacterium]MDX9921654.1 polyprenyl synthetase family protein [Syntrophales bacterium]